MVRDHQSPTRPLDLALVFHDVYGNVQYTKRHAQKKTVWEEISEAPAIAGALRLLLQRLRHLSKRSLASGAGKSVMSEDG